MQSVQAAGTRAEADDSLSLRSPPLPSAPLPSSPGAGLHPCSRACPRCGYEYLACRGRPRRRQELSAAPERRVYSSVYSDSN